MFGKDDPPSTAATIVEFLFKPLAIHGLIYDNNISACTF